MWQLFVFIVIVCVTSGICVCQTASTRQLHCLKATYTGMLREAAEHSIAASNNINPILALIEISRAAELMRVIVGVHGIEGRFLGVDLPTMSDVIATQKAKILADVLSIHKEVIGEQHMLTPVLTTPMDVALIDDTPPL